MAQVFNNEILETVKNGLATILGEWALSPASSLSLLNVSENATFRAVDTETERTAVFRVHRPDYHTKQEIESELRWVESLRTEGIVSTARPLPLKNGELIAELDDQNGGRYVVGFDFLSGVEPSPKDRLADDFFTLGAITARLHDHARSWAIPIGFKRKIWDYQSMLGNQPLWGDWRQAMGLKESGRQVLERTCAALERRLAEYGTDRHRFGLVHADLRLANLLVDGDRLSVIDFDDCGYSWFMYDFAAAISFMEESAQVPELQQSWITGYRTEARLPNEDEAMFPTFIMLRRILLTAWLASHSETETARDLGPTYTDGTVRLAEAYLESGTI
ncbi:phosphotransferase [bacterium]|nr:phosphotransferase [bacterium]